MIFIFQLSSDVLKRWSFSRSPKLHALFFFVCFCFLENILPWVSSHNQEFSASKKGSSLDHVQVEKHTHCYRVLHWRTFKNPLRGTIREAKHAYTIRNGLTKNEWFFAAPKGSSSEEDHALVTFQRGNQRTLRGPDWAFFSKSVFGVHPFCSVVWILL